MRFITVSKVKSFNFSGTCVNSFDDDGQAIGDIPYFDVTEFAQAEENSKPVDKATFNKHCNVPSKLDKIVNSKGTQFLFDTENNVYMAYDTKKIFTTSLRGKNVLSTRRTGFNLHTRI